MAITTRRAAAADAAVLHDLAARTFALACPPGTSREDVDSFVAAHLSLARFRGYLADPDRTLLLVLADDVPIGYSMLVSGPIADPDVRAAVDQGTSIELSKFYLLEAAHGSGAATVLMAATVDAAAASGARRCWLGVNQLNARAARFYERSGFTVIGTKRFLVGAQWHDDHIRARPLRQ